MPIIKSQNIKSVFFEDERIKQVFYSKNDVVEKVFQDKEKKIIITLNNGANIDLTPLNSFVGSVDWGDGTVDENKSHTYSEEGTYIIRGKFNDVISIGNSFLQGNTALTNIDLSDLTNLTSIGSQCLYNCQALTSIDLSNLINITSIGNNFLYNCRALTSIDLSDLTSLTSIGTSFLNTCLALTSIDLSDLTSLTSIGAGFLSNCSALTNIDLSDLTSLTSMEWGFLSYCSELTSIDLSNLINITSIGDRVLYNCSKLTSIDLSDLTNLTLISDNFLYNCQALTSIDLSDLTYLTSIGNNFLYNCRALTSIDLSDLTSLTSIGNDCLREAQSLSSINLSNLTNLTTIGQRVFMNIPSLPNNVLTSIDLSDLTSLTSIGDGFLSQYRALENINLSNLANLTSIGGGFLNTCLALTSIDLSDLTSLTSIGSSFLSDCRALTNLDLTPLINLLSIGNLFLNDCWSITDIYVPLKTPPTLSGWGERLNALEKIYCGEFVSQYKVASVWSQKASLMVGDEGIKITLSGSTTILLTQLVGLSGEIDWGDETVDENKTHTYSEAGTYTIKADFSTVSAISASFLRNLSTLTKVEFLSTIGEEQESINISGFFCFQCSNLTSINLKGLSKVKKLGGNFLSGCSSLINMENFNVMTLLEDLVNNPYAFRNCSSLETIDFSNFVNIYNLGDYFLEGCSSLKTLYLPLREPPILRSWGTGLDSLETIHCGSYLDSYKTNYYYQEKKDLLIE